MSYTWYSTNFKFKVVNGATTKTFKPSSEIGKIVSVGDGDIIVIEREKIDFTRADYIVGVKQKVKATFTAPYSKVITPATGYDSLESCLNNIGAGATLYYSLDDSDPSIPCYINSISRNQLDKKNVGVVVDIELESAGIVTDAWRTA